VLEAWRGSLRRGLYVAVALAVLAVAGLAVFGGGPAVVGRALLRLPPGYLALAAAGTALEWALDALRYVVAGRAVGVSLPFRTWLEVALVNLFAAYVANVGVPVAAYVIARRGASAGDALAVTVGKNLLFFPSALLPTWLLVWRAPDHVGGAPLLGMLTVLVALSVLQVGAMLAVAVWPAAAERFVLRLPLVRRWEGTSRFVAGMVRFFRGRPLLLAVSLGTALLNQAALVATIAALLRGFGGEAVDALGRGALARSYLFSTLSQVSPTPGGAGLGEAGGAMLFHGRLADASVAAFVVLSRFFCAGLPMFAGGLLLARELRASSSPGSRP
jgi:uncharacterized membrane protein YbhN (UPF0104 family)